MTKDKTNEDRTNREDRGNTADIAAYVEQTVQLLKLPVPPAQMPQVIENFQKLQVIAAPLLAFELPDDLEAAPQFEP
jgi:Protein of unknown function (DUF4089)